MKLKLTLLALVMAFGFSANAQQGPDFVGETPPKMYVPSLESRTNLIPADMTEREAQDKRATSYPYIIGKDPQTTNDVYASNPNPAEGTINTRSLLFDFEATASGSSPSDPALAVGPDHVMTVFNTGFRIFDKTGAPLTGQLSVTNIFSGGGCCDLTVSYDSAADRWVLSYLFSSNGQVQVAVSDGPDPVSAAWNVYTVPNVNDYNKLSVWRDGYYLTGNNGGNSSAKVWVVERAAALAGAATAGIQAFSMPGWINPNPGISFHSAQVLNVTNDDMPTSGGATVIYLADDSYGGVTTDHARYWTIDTDFATPGNSVVSAVTEIPLAPFISVFDGGGFSNLSQPGGGASIDAIQATIMNQAQFRQFPTYNSALFNFTVDTDAGGGKLAGIRWVELRQTGAGQPWTLHQEGTFTSPDGKHAWMGSLMMDNAGNIGMGYSAMAGPTTPNPTDFRVGSYYTGRFAADALGTMTVTETPIKLSTNNIPNLRYGDYSKIDIDPNNDQTFWFINEIAVGGRKDHVGVFDIAPSQANDVGATTITDPNDGALTAAEDVVATIFNFGTDPQTNIPVSLTVDGTAIVTDVIAGPLASATSISHTFSVPVDMSTPGTSYDIEVSTGLAGDSVAANDTATKTVTNTTLGVEDNILSDSDLLIVNKGNNMFDISLATQTLTERLTLTVTNVLGQNLLSYGLDNNGDGYRYELNMSYASSGVYIVRIGNSTSGVSKKLIVK
ncbi:T9SS type A sorting domain-containing protein [Rasiella rasia]|uniref:T9SS type A sorting domain-containing protein n=1 Tax=Rasiella rasia TaxID=2744027 RepID=A0A6G6GM11_9FLAO|nr:T9SS type A sorting domain-containing protein [Rasiella rasia]QIE59592.1 T9SS type A sorting domain-containing protein [Rasiella rasia]